MQIQLEKLDPLFRKCLAAPLAGGTTPSNRQQSHHNTAISNAHTSSETPYTNVGSTQSTTRVNNDDMHFYKNFSAHTLSTRPPSNICWYHHNFGVRANCCTYSCKCFGACDYLRLPPSQPLKLQRRR